MEYTNFIEALDKSQNCYQKIFISGAILLKQVIAHNKLGFLVGELNITDLLFIAKTHDFNGKNCLFVNVCLKSFSPGRQWNPNDSEKSTDLLNFIEICKKLVSVLSSKDAHPFDLNNLKKISEHSHFDLSAYIRVSESLVFSTDKDDFNFPYYGD